MTIRIRSWWKWQGPCIARVVKNRRYRNNNPKVPSKTRLDAPFSMQSVSISTTLDGDFARFAALVSRGKAETYFVRAIQYAAQHDALSGVVDVEREMFGALVLSRTWDMVSRKEGISVHDALVTSGICVTVLAGDDTRGDLEAHLEASKETPRETPPAAPPETLSRARSRTVPSRPGPGRGKEGREEGGGLRSVSGSAEGRSVASPAEKVRAELIGRLKVAYASDRRASRLVSAAGDMETADLLRKAAEFLEEVGAPIPDLRLAEMEFALDPAATNGHHPEEPR